MSIPSINKPDRKDFSAAPAYQRITSDLRHRIVTGVWAPGMMLPSRRVLAREYEVDLTTIQRAIAPLLADGVLRADGGRGTFVSESYVDGGQPDFRPQPSESLDAPRPLHRSQPAQKPAMIGLISKIYIPADGVHEYWEDFNCTVIAAMEREIAALGLSSVFTNLYHIAQDPTNLAQAIEELCASGADALAIIGVHDQSRELAVLANLPESVKRAIVYISSNNISLAVPNVYYDGRFGGYQAAEHLIECGCTDLVFVSPTSYPWAQLRVDGAREMLASVGRDPASLRVLPEGIFASAPSRAVLEPGYYQKVGHELADRYLTRSMPALGFIAATDFTAYGIMDAAEERGLKAGRDYRIIGFDDIFRSRMRGLTSLRPPLETMGAEAVRLLLRLGQFDREGIQIRLRSHLIARPSTRSIGNTDQEGA